MVSEELLILASCLLRPMSRNSVLEELSRYNPQALLSTSFVDHTIDLPWRNFRKSRVRGKFAEGSTLIFLEVAEFPYNTV